MNTIARQPFTVAAPALARPTRRRGLGRWQWLLLTCLILGAAGYLLRAKLPGRARAATQRYQTAEVTKRLLREVVSASGTLNPIVSVTVGVEVNGVIRKVLVDYNSPVKAGQAVAQIDTASYQAFLTQAEGDLANAQATLRLAENNLKRQRQLSDQKLIAPSDFDTAVASVEQARATVMTRQGARDKNKTDLEHCTIYSPIDGVVTSRLVDVGQTVASAFSTPTLFTIVNDLRNMQIDASVAEADIGGIAIGQAVDFTVDAYPSLTFHGKIKQVHNAPTSTTTLSSTSTTASGVVTYDTVIEVDNADLKLKPGMTASVTVLVAERENALAVPNAALRFTPAAAVAADAMATDTRRLYRFQDGRDLEAREIKTGITDGVYTEVLGGVNQGERVAVAVLSGASSKSAGSGLPPPPGGG